MKLFDETRPGTLDDVSWLRRAMRRELVGLRLSDELVNDMQLAVSELLTNVVVHSTMPPRTIRLSVSIIGASLRVDIEDDASAIELFEELWNVAARTDLAASGTSGLGLALARAALTNVTYTAGEPNRLTGWRPFSRNTATVLVVEDDATLLRIYTAMLRSRYRVLSATSIEAALAIAETTTIDLILSDFHLGEGMGTCLLQELDRNANRLPIPIIMISADLNAGTRLHAEGFGIEEFLVKPVNATTLRAAVERALHSSTRRRAGLLRHFGASADKLLAPPSPESLAALGVACRSGNATAGGGDFLILFTSDRRKRLVLVDVMGHGIGAKAGAITHAAVIRTVQQVSDGNAGAFLTVLSQVLFRDPALAEMIATVMVVDLNVDGSFTVASAAHPVPWIVSASGARLVEVGGAVVGLFDGHRYESVELRLTDGERLVLVTDGVEPMWIAGGGPLPNGLEQTLVDGITQPLREATDAAGAWLTANVGPAPRDDWSVVLLEPCRPAA